MNEATFGGYGGVLGDTTGEEQPRRVRYGVHDPNTAYTPDDFPPHPLRAQDVSALIAKNIG